MNSLKLEELPVKKTKTFINVLVLVRYFMHCIHKQEYAVRPHHHTVQYNM